MAEPIVLPISFGKQSSFDVKTDIRDDNIYVCGDSGNIYLGKNKMVAGVLFNETYEIDPNFGGVGQYCVTPYGISKKVKLTSSEGLSTCIAHPELSLQWRVGSGYVVSPEDGSQVYGSWFIDVNSQYVLFYTSTSGGSWFINKVTSTIENALTAVGSDSYAYFITSVKPSTNELPVNGTWQLVSDNTLFRMLWAYGNGDSAWSFFSGWEIDEHGALFINGKPIEAVQELFSDSAAIEINTNHINLKLSEAQNNIAKVLEDGLYIPDMKASQAYIDTGDTNIEWNVDTSILFLNHTSELSFTVQLLTSNNNTATYGKLFVRNIVSPESGTKHISFSAEGGTVYATVELPQNLNPGTLYTFDVWLVPNTQNTWYVVSHDGIATSTIAGKVVSTDPDDTDESVWGTINVDANGRMRVNNLKQLLNVRRYD